ncbi:histidine phosphatase family protein [Paeniglutamicibacter cryotolerans]|uniref:Putative phosphoglycerate mutase n=1 Tax=Paeniglutamicibacter cryotolerans TaxID=670079 RepID=A0A839QKQ4_9MICC|nr:histidine phosphatase family protein [Paeniglutamicibacter cryotolerans]MBB2995155.1 putative phosphoglycerate mutase [Paeniglutamicibacter cryotolerans]
MGAKLALVRHGETEWNAQGRLQGQTDIGLNDVGRQQARAAGRELASGGWSLVACSPLGRAVETAALIAAGVGLPAGGTDPDLMERHYGEGEGRMVAHLPRRDIDELLLTAEPEQQVAERGLRALVRLVRRYPGANIIVVAHGTLIRLTLDALGGSGHGLPGNGEVIEIDAGLLSDVAAH